jgi:tripartite-type tricarboxylate transporter receptor subunit TctC
MRLSRRALITALAATPAATLLQRRAFAAYPDHPIRLIVPFAAGGNADTVARLTADGMTAALGQPIVVENRAGAGGSIGAEAVARAEPDGYTMLAGSNGPLTVNPFVQPKLGYDPMKDFTPIGLTSLVAHALTVHPSVAAKTLQEVIALSHKQQVGIGTAGVGSATHLTLARFNAATGAKLVHVPYRGGGALLPDLISGAIQGAMVEFSTVLPLHQGGKTRILATAAAKRSELAGDIPTMIEAGVKDFTAASYVGVLVPAKTPAEAVAALEKALGKSLTDPARAAKFKQLGTEVATGELLTSKGFAAFLKAEYERSGEAAKLAGIKKS